MSWPLYVIWWGDLRVTTVSRGAIAAAGTRLLVVPGLWRVASMACEPYAIAATRSDCSLSLSQASRRPCDPNPLKIETETTHGLV